VGRRQPPLPTEASNARLPPFSLRGDGRGDIKVWGATAEIYTRQEVRCLVKLEELSEGPSEIEIVQWAAARLAERPVSTEGPRLRRALVARITPDGRASESVFFMDQRGESGCWKLGSAYWDSVHETEASSAGRVEDLIWAHPDAGSILLVAFPDVLLDRSLEITYGIADSGLDAENDAGVDVLVYAGETSVGRLEAPSNPGWRTDRVDTANLRGRREVVSLLVSTSDSRYRHFHFDFVTSRRSAK